MVIWIVDSDHWSRALLRAELIERGVDAETELRALAGLGAPIAATGSNLELASGRGAALSGAVQRPRPVTIGQLAETAMQLAWSSDPLPGFWCL